MNNFLNGWQQVRELYAARTEPESIRPLAETVWRTLLIGACVALVAIIFYAVTIFTAVIQNLESAPRNVAPPAALDRVKLDALIAAINARGAIGTPPPVVPATAPVRAHSSPGTGDIVAPAK